MFSGSSYLSIFLIGLKEKRYTVDLDSLGIENEPDPYIRQWKRQFVDRVASYDHFEPYKSNANFEELLPKSPWSYTPNMRPVFTEDWLKPITDLIKKTTRSFIFHVSHSKIIEHIHTGMDVFLNRTGLIDDLVLGFRTFYV